MNKTDSNSRRVAKLERVVALPVNGEEPIVLDGTRFHDRAELLQAARARGCRTLIFVPVTAPPTAEWVADVGPAGFCFEGARDMQGVSRDLLRKLLCFVDGVPYPGSWKDEPCGGYSWNDAYGSGRRSGTGTQPQ